MLREPHQAAPYMKSAATSSTLTSSNSMQELNNCANLASSTTYVRARTGSVASSCRLTSAPMHCTPQVFAARHQRAQQHHQLHHQQHQQQYTSGVNTQQVFVSISDTNTVQQQHHHQQHQHQQPTVATNGVAPVVAHLPSEYLDAPLMDTSVPQEQQQQPVTYGSADDERVQQQIFAQANQRAQFADAVQSMDMNIQPPQPQQPPQQLQQQPQVYQQQIPQQQQRPHYLPHNDRQHMHHQQQHQMGNNNYICQQQQQQQPQPQQQQHHHHNMMFSSSSDSSPSASAAPSECALSLGGINLEQYISKRNERERSRVRNVNDAFDNLKNTLPLDYDRITKRMSKVEILRTAIGYIRNLEHVLGIQQQQHQHQHQHQHQQQQQNGQQHQAARRVANRWRDDEHELMNGNRPMLLTFDNYPGLVSSHDDSDVYSSGSSTNGQ